MRIRLKKRRPRQPREQRPLDLGLGVRVYIEPVTTAAIETARSEARADLDGLINQAELRVQAGLDLGDLPDPEDNAALDGLFYGLFCQALARRHIKAWEGVSNHDGTADEPVTPKNVDALMLLYPFGERFMAAATADALAMVAQKKSSTSGRAGTGAAASPIAGPAPTPTSPAPAASPDATAGSALTSDTN